MKKALLSLRTGYLETSVYADGEAFLWRRSPGRMRPEGFRAVPAGIRATLETLELDDLRVVPGVSSGGSRWYRVDRPTSVALDLSGQLPAISQENLATDVATVSKGLGALHRALPASGDLAPPAGAA